MNNILKLLFTFFFILIYLPLKGNSLLFSQNNLINYNNRQNSSKKLLSPLEKAIKSQLFSKAIFLAIAEKKFEIAKNIVNNHSNTLTSTDLNGLRPLEFAIISGYCNENSITPIKKECLAFLKFLVNSKAPLNNNASGYSPLHYSTSLGYFSLTNLILSQNSHLIHLKDLKKRTALHHSILNKHFHISTLLLNRFNSSVLNQDFQGNNALHLATNFQSLKLIKLLLKKVPFASIINATNHLNMTPIHIAVNNRNLNILKFLLRKETNLEISSSLGTPLHIATNRGFLNIVNLLIQKGSSINSLANKEKLSPISQAIIQLSILTDLQKTKQSRLNKRKIHQKVISYENIIKLFIKNQAILQNQDKQLLILSKKKHLLQFIQ